MTTHNNDRLSNTIPNGPDVLQSTDAASAIAALRASEARFHHMAANVPGMVYQFVLDPDGRQTFSYVSDACQAIYGLAPEAIYADATLILDVVHPDDRVAFDTSIAESAATLTPWAWEGRIVLASGGEKWLQGASRPTRSSNGTITWDGLLLDITARKQAERDRDRLFADVQHQRQQLDDLLANIPGVVWEVSSAFEHPQLTFVSTYAELMLGYSVSEWLTTPDFWRTIMHPDDWPAAEQASVAAMRDKGSNVVQWRWRRRDGQTIWTETHQRSVIDAHGAVTGLRGVTMDITARHVAEAEQRRLQEEIIRVQEAMLAELSTPLIPISEHVVVMPLIGALDSRRAQQVVETLLAGIDHHRVHTAIVDITGVPVVDTQVANSLLRAAQAVRLLGAHVVLTGIRPEVAQTLVGLGVDLAGIVTHSTLQRGIVFALGAGRPQAS